MVHNSHPVQLVHGHLDVIGVGPKISNSSRLNLSHKVTFITFRVSLGSEGTPIETLSPRFRQTGVKNWSVKSCFLSLLVGPVLTEI